MKQHLEKLKEKQQVGISTLPEISNFYILSQYLGVTINDLIVPMNRKDFDLYTSVNARGLMSYYFRISRMIRLQMSS